MDFKAKPTPSFIALIYLLVGILWMFFSDYISLAFLTEPSGYWYLQNIEEISFLVASGILIFFMTYSYGKDHEAYNSKLEDKLKEKEELNQQIQSRINESIGLASNLIENKSSTATNGSVQKSLDDFQSRIQLISYIHKQFFETTESSKISIHLFIEYLADRIQSKFNAIKGDTVVIQKVEPLSCSVKEAILITLIVNELITNIYHHAFKEQKEGKLYINMYQKTDKIHVIIADNGSGLPHGFDLSKANTVGFSFIKILVKQLKGEISYQGKTGKGTKFHIIFPSKRVASYDSINEQWSA